MDSAIIAEIVIAIISLIASTAISENQMKSSEGRNSRETFVRHIYQAVKDKFNVSIDQLNQAADKLGIRLSQLAESSRGSARLSIASKLLREFTQRYPELVDAVNQTKNDIQREINNLSAKESAAASRIENRQEVTNNEVLRDAVGSISNVNDSLNRLSQVNGGSGNNNIDTSLIEKQLKEDRTEQQAREEKQKEEEQPHTFMWDEVERRTQPQIMTKP